MRPITVTLSWAGDDIDPSVNYHSIAGWVECPDRP